MARHCVWVRVHLVWSTKFRESTIAASWKESLYAYISGIIRNRGGRSICIGGTEDHIHIYLSLPSRVSLSVMVNSIKTNSCRWVRMNHAPGFAWQRGYGAFSMNLRNESRLIRYIREQEEIHRQRDFVNEFLSYARVHGISPAPDVLT